MNKAKQMQKKIGTLAAMIAVLVAVAAGVMMFTTSSTEDALKRKTDAESARSNDNSQIASMRAQIDQSGAAEKRFVDIQLMHTNPDYSANSEALKEWLRAAKDQYRFANNFKLTLALEQPANKPEFTALNFDVKVRDPVKIELGAMSDTHVYSFLDQMVRESPGMLRITKFELERRLDMDNAAYRQMLSGLSPENVGARIEFTWVGIEPKLAAPAAETTPTAPPGT